MYVASILTHVKPEGSSTTQSTLSVTHKTWSLIRGSGHRIKKKKEQVIVITTITAQSRQPIVCAVIVHTLKLI